MKKSMSWNFTDEPSVTFQSSISGPGEFGLSFIHTFFRCSTSCTKAQNDTEWVTVD